MNPQHYAVVVGINRYPELEPLNSAVGDAESFEKWLGRADGGGLDGNNIVLITDTPMANGTPRKDAIPTKVEIHEALFELANRCKNHVEEHPGDWKRTRLYLYLSGHGLAPVPDEAALLMANSGPDWYGENLPCSRFVEYYKSAQFFREIVVFADCCRYWVDNAPIADPPWTKKKGNYGKVHAVAGYATFFGDPAYEPPEDQLEPADQRRSYFTKALIEGLGDRAADPATGQIDSIGLARYVKDRVRELTKDKRAPQEPQFPGDQAAPIVFRHGLTQADVEQAQTHAVRITVATAVAGPVRLIDGARKELERHDVIPVPWEVPLRAGLYRLVPAQEGVANPLRNGGFINVVGEDLDVEL